MICPGFKNADTATYSIPVLCPAGFYCPKGSATAIACPKGASTFGLTGRNSPCGKCPRGSVAPNEGSADCMECPSGSYSPVEEGALTCLTCVKPEGCAEGGGFCSVGYTDTLCAVCDTTSTPRYYESSGSCQKCAQDPTQTIIAVLVALVVYYLVSRIELSLHHIIRLKIYSTFFQLMSLVMYVEVPWPPLVHKYTALFYTLSFNIEVAHPECTVNFNYFEKLKMVIAAPFAFGLFLGLISRYLYVRKVSAENKSNVALSRYYRRRWKILRQLMVIFWTCTYSPVCYYSLRMFESCITDENGVSVMPSDTRLLCGSEAYNLHKALACIALAIFGIGIPVGVIVIVSYLKKRHLLNTGDSLLRYGALYEWYNDDFAWFEAFSLTRKGLMLLPVTLLSDELYQAFGMMIVTISYAGFIVYFKPFIRFPLKLKYLNYDVDFYNFLESTASLVTGFDLFLGALAALDGTKEAANAIGVLFIIVNSLLVGFAIMSFESGLRKVKKIKKKQGHGKHEIDPNTGKPYEEDDFMTRLKNMKKKGRGFQKSVSPERVVEQPTSDSKLIYDYTSYTIDPDYQPTPRKPYVEVEKSSGWQMSESWKYTVFRKKYLHCACHCPYKKA